LSCDSAPMYASAMWATFVRVTAAAPALTALPVPRTGGGTGRGAFGGCMPLHFSSFPPLPRRAGPFACRGVVQLVTHQPQPACGVSSHFCDTVVLSNVFLFCCASKHRVRTGADRRRAGLPLAQRLCCLRAVHSRLRACRANSSPCRLNPFCDDGAQPLEVHVRGIYTLVGNLTAPFPLSI
jgi:hypothetical protein